MSESDLERIQSLVGISPRRLAILEEKAAILDGLVRNSEAIEWTGHQWQWLINVGTGAEEIGNVIRMVRTHQLTKGKK